MNIADSKRWWGKTPSKGN
jgi:hypothetical protein